MDIYKQLAADILGKPADDVTLPERATAKQAFRAVAQLPDNEHLLAKAGD